MRTWMLLGMASLLGIVFLVAQQSPAPGAKVDGTTSQVPAYTADGQLMRPAQYREWIYLTSGLDMSYSPLFRKAGHSIFDNVFVNPEAYKAFVETGTWPDKTMLVVEVRGAESKGSINKNGHFQTSLMGVEVHVKDETRFQGKWAFFGFEEESTAKQIPHEAQCYSCHEQHGAVDTTFVQFYPTLLELAKKKHTLSPAYVKEEELAAHGEPESLKR